MLMALPDLFTAANAANAKISIRGYSTSHRKASAENIG
jgi:hypothetical protein